MSLTQIHSSDRCGNMCPRSFCVVVVFFYYHQLDSVFFRKGIIRTDTKTKLAAVGSIFLLLSKSAPSSGLGGRGKGSDSRSLAVPGDHQGLTRNPRGWGSSICRVLQSWGPVLPGWQGSSPCSGAHWLCEVRQFS